MESDPPPYASADYLAYPSHPPAVPSPLTQTLSLLVRADALDVRTYPLLCLVSRDWATVFQSALWSRPHRYFITPSRSANGNKLSFVCSQLTRE